MALLNTITTMKKYSLLIALLLPLLIFGQQESYYSLYRYNMNVINPAYAGAEAANMLSLTSRRQWASMDDAPSTVAMSFSCRAVASLGENSNGQMMDQVGPGSLQGRRDPAQESGARLTREPCRGAHSNTQARRTYRRARQTGRCTP